MTSKTQFQDLLAVFRRLPGRRRKQFGALLCLMLLGALAEFVALGAIIPFMSVMADPVAFLDEQQSGWVPALLGEADADSARLILTVCFLAIVLVAGAVRLLILWATGRFSLMVGYDLSMIAYRNLVEQDYAFHLKDSSAELVGAMQKIGTFSRAVLTPVMQALTALVTVVFIIAALLVINIKVALLTFGLILGLYLLLLAVFQPVQRRNSVIIAAAQSDKVRLVQEAFGGIRDIIVNGLQGAYIRQFRGVEYGLRVRQAQNMLMSNAPRLMVETTLLVAAATALYFLSTGLNDLAEILPTAVAFAVGLQRILPYMQVIYRGRAQIAGNAASTADVRGYVDIVLPPKSDGTAVSFEVAITLENVCFRYGAEGNYALQDITLSIPKGSFIGITGQSGSGKSTLIDVIMGLHLTDCGALRVDGEVIAHPALRGWRAHIAHVSQAVFLIEGSVRENIALGVDRADIDDARLQEAIRLSELTDVIGQLDIGLDTRVGERGARLSGGQRQRIGIARALYLNRDVMVLDEATSALDNATQEKVMANIRSMRRDMTIISITHRLDTLAGCDQIFELNQGRLVGRKETP